MDIITFSQFEALKTGDRLELFNQELNPPVRGKVDLLSIEWTHDRVDGDLVFGSLRIPGIGDLETDAWTFRTADTENDAGTSPQAWLSSARIPKGLSDTSYKWLTGGPLHTKPLMPSEMHARSDPRDALDGSKLPRPLYFTREQYSALERWQNGLEEKRYVVRLPNEGYARYKRDPLGKFSGSFENNGLEGHIEVWRERKGLMSSTFGILVHDSSFRTPATNPRVINARPRSTQVMREQAAEFSELLSLMHQALNLVVERNEGHIPTR